jgi:hypothetical protein
MQRHATPSRGGGIEEWHLVLSKGVHHLTFRVAPRFHETIIRLGPALLSARLISVGPIRDPVASDRFEQLLLLLPDEGHGFARPPTDLASFTITEAYLAGFLGGRHEALGDAFTDSSVGVPVGAADVLGLAGKLPQKKD